MFSTHQKWTEVEVMAKKEKKKDNIYDVMQLSQDVAPFVFYFKCNANTRTQLNVCV